MVCVQYHTFLNLLVFCTISSTVLEIFLVAVKEHQAGRVADALISETDEPTVNNSEQWQPTSALVHLSVR